jgi:hypothetical protein
VLHLGRSSRDGNLGYSFGDAHRDDQEIVGPERPGIIAALTEALPKLTKFPLSPLGLLTICPEQELVLLKLS